MFLTFLLITVIYYAFFLLQEAAPTVSASEGIAIGIAGVAAPILTTLLKKFTGASGFTAVVVALIVSAGIALVAMYMAGEIHSFGDVVKQVGSVFALSQLIYRGYLAAKESSERSMV